MLGVAYLAAAEHKLLQSEVAGRETELARLWSALLEQSWRQPRRDHLKTLCCWRWANCAASSDGAKVSRQNMVGEAGPYPQLTVAICTGYLKCKQRVRKSWQMSPARWILHQEKNWMLCMPKKSVWKRSCVLPYVPAGCYPYVCSVQSQPLLVYDPGLLCF